MRKPHHHHPKPRSIVEFGVEVTDGQIRRIETFLRSQKIAFYVLPPAEPPYATLDELRDDCEGEIATTAR